MNLKELHPENKDIQTKLLLKIESATVISIQIAKGKQLKDHKSNIPATLFCVTGNAVYTEENKQFNLVSGDYVSIESNVIHRVDAIEESNFLLIR